MDYKKSKAPTNTVTHNLMDFAEPTGNIYESIVIMSKRANQIGAKMKEDLSRKLKEFASSTENLEETFENREQIEISRYYERLPKPTLIARAARRLVVDEPALTSGIRGLRAELSSLGGTKRIVREVEKLVS